MNFFVPLRQNSRKVMKKLLLFFPLAAALLAGACGNHDTTAPLVADSDDVDSLSMPLNGDSTTYGLVCDGCTDTILIFLPLNDVTADPDTFYILEAMKAHRVLGQPRVGDRVAVVRSAQDSTVASYVIDMEDLIAHWGYQVLPTLRQRADQHGMSARQIANEMDDSLRQLLTTPVEYGLQLNVDHTARTTGRRHRNEEIPVAYPTLVRYGQWQFFNGRLLLTRMGLDSLGNRQLQQTDTASLLLLGPDTLVLQFADRVQGYYRVKE